MKETLRMKDITSNSSDIIKVLTNVFRIEFERKENNFLRHFIEEKCNDVIYETFS